MSAYDIIVLGSGPGGYVAAIRASQLGFNTAIIEKEALGGVCLNWGCIPTKALLKSAQVYQYLQDCENYGIQTASLSFDFKKIIARSRNVAETMSRGVKFLMKKNKISVIEGYGKIKPGKTIEVTEKNGQIKEYKANHIIIATGSRPKQLPALPLDGAYIFDYRKALTLEELPKSLIIVGAGAIGCEFAHFYQTMGTSVTLIEFFNRIAPSEDEEISKQLHQSFTQKGMKILTTSRVYTSKIEDNQVIIGVSTPQGEIELQADHVLSATGVVANTDNIGIEPSGIMLEHGKIKINSFYQTNCEDYFAIGDITRGPALAHVASAEAIICVEKIAGLQPSPLDYENIPSCIYTSPEIASVGLTESKAREQGYDILIGKFPFTASGKAQASGHPEGFIKIIYDKKYGELLGAHFIGEHVTELIGEIVTARNLGTTGHEILKSVHPHPTLSEVIVEATAAAYGEAIHI